MFQFGVLARLELAEFLLQELVLLGSLLYDAVQLLDLSCVVARDVCLKVLQLEDVFLDLTLVVFRLI